MRYSVLIDVHSSILKRTVQKGFRMLIKYYILVKKILLIPKSFLTSIFRTLRQAKRLLVS